MKHPITIPALLLLLTACGGGGKSTTPDAKQVFDVAAVRAHITEMNKSYGERFLTNDSAFYERRYCKDAVAMPEKMPAVNGRDSIRRFYYNNGENKPVKIEIIAGSIYGGPDAVIEEGIYNFPDGKGGSFDKGKFIAIWKQEDGQWKLHREIWNTDIHPPEK
jgi:ketosteroid isomerase-like protein